MQKKTHTLTLITILFLFWIYLFQRAIKSASEQEVYLASAIYFICCLPVLIYFLRSEKNIPYLPVFGGLYFIYFGLAVLLHYNLFIVESLDPEVIIKSLSMVLAGIVSLMIAFYSPLSKIVDLVVTPLKLPWNTSKAYRLGVSLGIIGIIAQYSNLVRFSPLAFVALINFIEELSRFGIAILYMLKLQNRLNLKGKLVFWLVLFIPKLCLDLISGATSKILVDFMILFFLYFYHFRSIPWRRAIIVSLIFFVIFSARNRFRELTWYGGEYEHTSKITKLILYTKLIQERLSGEKEEFGYAYEQLTSRTDNLLTLAKVTEQTPEYVPYWGGYTYSTLLTSFIPRFLMPEKTKKTLGLEFGHRYGFLSPQDISTSYNLPIAVEFYINFGAVGIVIGMFILGLIFRTFYALFNHPNSGDGGFLISVMIFSNLINIESDFSLVFGNIIQHIILFYFISKRMRLKLERTEKPVQEQQT